MTSRTEFNIGTRRSKLAMTQTLWVKAQLEAVNPTYTFNVIEQDTIGDLKQDVALAKIGDKGLFTQELEVGLTSGAIDFAVHSLKDLLTTLPIGLTLGCITERWSPADVVLIRSDLVAQGFGSIDELNDHPNPAMRNIGTSSLRRQAQLSALYPKLNYTDCRGNLDTRISKLENGDFAAIVLARAGLERQGAQYSDRIAHDLENVYYAVGQGALGIECRADDKETLALLSTLHHQPTAWRCEAERALMATLEGGCHAPIGVITTLAEEDTVLLTIKGRVLSLDGTVSIEDEITGDVGYAKTLGVDLGNKLLKAGAANLLRPSPAPTPTSATTTPVTTNATPSVSSIPSAGPSTTTVPNAKPTGVKPSACVNPIGCIGPGCVKHGHHHGFGANSGYPSSSFGVKQTGFGANTSGFGAKAAGFGTGGQPKSTSSVGVSAAAGFGAKATGGVPGVKVGSSAGPIPDSNVVSAGTTTISINIDPSVNTHTTISINIKPHTNANARSNTLK